MYRYNIHGKKISGEIKIKMQEVGLAEISSLNENIILALGNIHKQFVALDFESKSISRRLCLVNATAGSLGYSDEDDNSLECNTDPQGIKMMTQDDNYIYGMDNANSILAIDNIKGLYIEIDIANNNCHVISCANFNIFLTLEGDSAGKNLISLLFGIMQP